MLLSNLVLMTSKFEHERIVGTPTEHGNSLVSPDGVQHSIELESDTFQFSCTTHLNEDGLVEAASRSNSYTECHWQPPWRGRVYATVEWQLNA